MKTPILILFFCAIVNAQLRPLPTPQIEYQPRRYIAMRVASALTIDGRLNEEVWHKAYWSNNFVDIKGGDSPLPRYQTRFKLLWDDRYFYIAAEMEEPHIWATLTDRDAIIYYDNDFEIFIDPDGDTHNYFELEINALNTVWDLFLDKPYRDGAHPLNGWDIHGLQSAVQINGTLNDPADSDSGWTVEMAIPWKAFQFKANRPAVPQIGQQWRMNFSRVQWQTKVENGRYVKMKDESGKVLREDNWVWSPQGLIAMHYPEMWGIVKFTDRRDSAGTTPVTEGERLHSTWLLRQLYYRQKNYFRKFGRYASWLELNFSEREWPKDIAPPKIFISPVLWEARLADPRGEGEICIRYDGLQWHEKK